MKEQNDSMTNISKEDFWDLCQDSFDNSDEESDFFSSVQKELQSNIGFKEGKFHRADKQNDVENFVARVKEIIDDYGSDFKGDEADEILREYLRKYRYKTFHQRSFESKDYGVLKIISYKPTAAGVLTLKNAKDDFLDFSDKTFEEQFIQWM